MPWEDILADPEFQAQPAQIKAQVAMNYFKQNVADKDFLRQPPGVQAEVKQNFLGTLQVDTKPRIWNDQLKPTLLETGKQIFEIPKTIGDVALGFGGGALGWGLGSVAGIAEATKPGATRESVQQARENIESRLSFEPRTQPGQVLMEKAGRLMGAVTGPAAEASALVGESWDSPFLEAVLKFAGEAATFEAMGKATKIRPNIKAPEWYRRMTIPERGLVEGIKADLSSGQFTPEQIRQMWKDPANRAELLKRYQGVGRPAPEQAGTFAPEKAPTMEGRLSNPIIADALLKAAREKALPGPEGMDMNIGQDFTVTPSRALADMIIRSGRGRLPAGQTPMLPEPPASSPVAPEIALLAALTRKRPALPPGQGFELVSPEEYLKAKAAAIRPRFESDAFDMTRPFERGKIEFEAPPAKVSPDKPVSPDVEKGVESAKLPGMKPMAERMANAENSFVDAVQEQFGKTKEEAERILERFKKEKLVKIDPVTGQYELKHGRAWERDVIDRAAKEGAPTKPVDWEAATDKTVREIIISELSDMVNQGEAGLRVDSSEGLAQVIGRYTTNPDWYGEFQESFKRATKKSVNKDEILSTLKKMKDGGSFTDKQILIANRLNKIIKEQSDTPYFRNIYDELAKENKPKISVGDLKEGDKVVIDGEEFIHKGFDEDGFAILKDGEPIRADVGQEIAVDEIIPGKPSVLDTARKTPDAKNADLEGLSAAETFTLDNPETQWGEFKAPGNAPKTATLFSGVDPVAAYESLRSLKDDIQAALPHLEALGRRIYESGKTDLKSWAGAMKRTLGDLWDSFKDVMVRVWRTVSKPLANQKGAVGDFESFRKAAKDGDVQAARREYERLRQEALTPVSGNKLDEAATGYLKTGNFQDYLDNMPTLGELKPQDIFKYDPGAKRYIASYLTGDGKLKPAIRQSGFHALRSFADYFKDKKDISKRDIMWVDPTRMIQGIDGGVMGGAAQQHILWPTRSTVLARLQWNDKQKGELARIQEARNIHSGKKAETVGDVVEYIEFKEKDGKVYIGGKVPRELLKDWKPGEQAEIIEAAKDIRRFSKKLLDDQNAARQRRGEKPIPYRSFYRPWVIKANLWSKLMGRVLKPSDVMEAAEAPDFINPNRPFNPREQAREGGLKNYDKERNIIRLMADYVDTAGKDIFNANIVHNNKIHAAILKAQNMENAAAAVNVWTAEAFGGVSPRITKVAREILPQPIHRGMLSLRRQLTRAVFPLNFLWNLSIQTSSAGVTYMRYGEKANLAGLRYLTDRQFNEAVKRHAYSAAVKARWGGSMSYQDVGQSLGKMRQLEASKIETAEHYANFLTQAIEDGLTGHAVAAAYYHGKKLGLTGRALWEYASEGGAKTQSMYNLEDAPGLLRAREVGAVAPFQTFAFEMFNTVREMNFPVLRNVIGKTGLYETMSASTAAGKAAMSNRLKMLARWVAACLVTNMVVEEETGRNPWGPSAFIPFYALTVGLVIEGQYTRGLPTPIQYGRDFKKGVTDVIEYGSFKRLRRWALRYHMVAGTQVERTLSGIEAVARGGVYDVRGRELFPVKGASEQVRAVAGGPWFTRAGIERLREKSARSLLGPTPEQDLSRKARTRRRPTRRRRAD